jgi:rod shape-determining protein MreC
MRNVFLFFRRFSTFFTFLFLQVFCLAMVFKYNSHHNALGLTMANNVTGKIHEQKAKINGFFTLRQTADSLVKRNAELLNQKGQNSFVLDTSIREKADYIQLDTLGNTKKILQFVYRPANVIYSTTNQDKRNYMILARGTNAGVNIDMAVIGAETKSVVGKVVYADANYSYVMTLLHQKSIIPAKLASNNENGIIKWNGNNNHTVTLERISKTVDIKVGDSIVTSNSSDIFPQDLLIGTIQSFSEDKATGNHKIIVKTAANFHHINYVEVVENKQQKETRALVTNAEKILGTSKN